MVPQPIDFVTLHDNIVCAGTEYITRMTITDPLVSSQHSDHSGTKMVGTDLTNMEEGLLSAKMLQNGKECYLSLKESRLIIETPKKSKGTTIINFKDIIGAVPNVKKNKNAETDFYFEVYSFGMQTGGCGCCGGSSKGERKQRVDEFQCQDAASFWNWQHAINCAIRQLPIMKGDGDLLLPPPRRRMLVVVNPVGGTGIALKIWKRDTEPMLIAGNIEYTLLTTERANHAKEYVANEDLSIFSTIVIIGGDGLIFEVVSGVMARDDHELVFRNLPLAPIPGGSGNGLAKSILFECGETCSTKVATFVAITGVPSYLDISKATTNSESHFSFLALSWGMIADVDINSESLRWMGEARFTVSGVSRVITKKFYRGRLSMLLADSEKGDTPTAEKCAGETETGTGGEEKQSGELVVLPPLSESLDATVAEDPASWLVLEDDFLMVWAVQTSHASTSMYTGPGVTLNDGVFTVTLVRGKCSRLTLLKILIEMETGTHFQFPELEVYKAKAFRLEPLTEEGLYSLDGEMIEYGPVQCEMHSTTSLQILKTDNNKAAPSQLLNLNE